MNDELRRDMQPGPAAGAERRAEGWGQPARGPRWEQRPPPPRPALETQVRLIEISSGFPLLPALRDKTRKLIKGCRANPEPTRTCQGKIKCSELKRSAALQLPRSSRPQQPPRHKLEIKDWEGGQRVGTTGVLTRTGRRKRRPR